ncbi:hypothetical protein E1301_Tti006708 [Triplophysa tibetana]|uniref:Uncharacterized protein n=1 Tax=Triplophysa tibetana TaxID=1572043 RepID=A0A5A9PBP5_9TELE|nr:hypothetical protein E1301_Tti006708 [Triplophysa tibetana]
MTLTFLAPAGPAQPFHSPPGPTQPLYATAAPAQPSFSNQLSFTSSQAPALPPSATNSPSPVQKLLPYLPPSASSAFVSQLVSPGCVGKRETPPANPQQASTVAWCWISLQCGVCIEGFISKIKISPNEDSAAALKALQREAAMLTGSQARLQTSSACIRGSLLSPRRPQRLCCYRPCPPEGARAPVSTRAIRLWKMPPDGGLGLLLF